MTTGQIWFCKRCGSILTWFDEDLRGTIWKCDYCGQKYLVRGIYSSSTTESTGYCDRAERKEE